MVREAVADYHARIGRLSESERQRMLKIFDTLFPLIPKRPQREAEEELKEIRRATAIRRTVVDIRQAPVIVLDTSVLIDGLTGLKRSGPAIRNALAEGRADRLTSVGPV